MTIQIVLACLAGLILYMVVTIFRKRTGNEIFSWLPLVFFIVVEFKQRYAGFTDERIMFLASALTYCVLHLLEAYKQECM